MDMYGVDISGVNTLEHYGTKRHSGRYPWGSGENPYQHGSGDFLSRVNELKAQGLSEVDIAKSLGISTTQLRVYKRMANNQRRAEMAAKAKKLQEEGMNPSEIAREMGFKSESSVRNLLNEGTNERMSRGQKTADFLKQRIDEKGMIDIGAGVEAELGISKNTMSEAVEILRAEGYEVYPLGIKQAANPKQQSNTQIACPPGTKYKDAYSAVENGKISTVVEYHSEDGGKSFLSPERPVSIDSSRVMIRYGDKGGDQRDGLIEIRPGVEDLSLGKSTYAQVRIAVDGTHYLKGMAVYSDDLPDGVDIRFNTNKKSGTDKMDVLKQMKNDPDNPFGANIQASGQVHYIGKDGKEHLGAINKIHEEGEYLTYSKETPAQFLSKQPQTLVKKQLNLAYSDKLSELDDICQLTNPVVKKHYLREFADNCDSAAVDLKAAALPRSRYQVLLPVPELKDNEIYAPGYKPGEKVALVRFPHGGTFEIPILTVNNKNPYGKKTVGNAMDAVGINKNVADRLSGADFDGDTVMVIPTGGKVKINSTPPLKGLEGFDPKDAYPGYEGMKKMTKAQKQTQMGIVSNLITDMTIKGATPEEKAMAVRHSMVVIDAEKHGLNYKQSEIDNNISALKKKYQTHYDSEGNLKSGGSSTLLSSAKSPKYVTKRKGEARINQKGKPWYDKKLPEGALIYKEDPNARYIDKRTGKELVNKQKSTLMAETRDARTLSSGSPVEELYADYANSMKALANQARKEMVYTPNLKYDKQAKKTYSAEVASLNAKLNESKKIAPRERQANVIAGSTIKAKMAANPDMTTEEKKRLKTQELNRARESLGITKGARKFIITDREWQAIQAGAISNNKLEAILANTDPKQLRERSMPSKKKGLSDAKIAKAKAMRASGYNLGEIADSLNVSASTVSKAIA